MAVAIALRGDFSGPVLRKLGKATKDAARIGGVGLQTVRDWVLRFNARGPAGLIDGKAPGNASKPDDAQRRALADIVERGPIPAIHEVVRWRLADLAQWIWEGEPLSAIGPRTMASGTTLSETAVGREFKVLGYVKISARPRHYAQNERAIDDFKKDFQPNWK